MPRIPTLGLAVLLSVAAGACATAWRSGPADGPPPEGCQLQYGGAFRIDVDPDDRFFDLQQRIEELGYDRARGVEPVYEVEGGSRRVVAYEGTGLRWNEPSCRRR